MKSTKEWFSAKDLEGIVGLPNRATNITRKAMNEGWEKRDVKGIKGGGFEYHYTSLPQSVQQALGFNRTPTEAATQDVAIVRTAIGDTLIVSRARLKTAIETLEEILEITHKTMKPAAKAQMVLMIYELLSEESANEKIVEMIKLVA